MASTTPGAAPIMWTAFALGYPNAILRRCAADRKIVEHWQITKAALDAAEGVVLQDTLKVRLGAYYYALTALAEGYGLTEEDANY